MGVFEKVEELSKKRWEVICECFESILEDNILYVLETNEELASVVIIHDSKDDVLFSYSEEDESILLSEDAEIYYNILEEYGISEEEEYERFITDFSYYVSQNTNLIITFDEDNNLKLKLPMIIS